MVLSLLLLTIRHDTTPPHEKLTLRISEMTGERKPLPSIRSKNIF
jgi:hypothetical protein